MYNAVECAKKIANRFHHKYKPTLPIPINELITEYADLIEVEFPFQFDGLCVDLKVPQKRPKVFIKKSTNRRRKRFTLAHELGHIFIPWHEGTITDSINDFNKDDDFHYWVMEEEANAFASELLMPPHVMSDIVRSSDAIEEIIESVREECDVSTLSAIYRCAQFLPKNNVICFSYNGAEYKYVRSPGTRIHSIKGGTLAQIREDDLPNGERTEFCIGSYNFVHWHFPERLPFPMISEDGDWRVALDGCLTPHFGGTNNTQRIKQRLNGIISSINSSLRNSKDNEELYAAFIHRISNDTEFSILLENPLFHDFAALRILDFLSRR